MANALLPRLLLALLLLAPALPTPHERGLILNLSGPPPRRLTENRAEGRFPCGVSALFPRAWQNTALQQVVFWARPRKSQRVRDSDMPSPSRKAELVFDTHPNPLAHSLGGDSGGTEKSLALTPCPMVQDTGELCMQSFQCKSGCCHRTSGLSLARCAPKAAESQDCSPPTLYGTYYKCPCESGLTCDADKSIVGSIINKNFGVCKDSQESSGSR